MALFLLLAVAACRETPRQPATADEEHQDADYLTQLYNTRAINGLDGEADPIDYNRTRGRDAYKDYYRNRAFRLNMVGYRVLIAAYPLCPHDLRTRSMMMGIATRARTPPVVEWAITPFDQADNKTLKLGDEILAMGNENIPVGLTGALTARRILADYANRMAPLQLYVKREDKREDEHKKDENDKTFSYLHITQQPQNFCNYEFAMDNSAKFNAYADDKSIHVNSTAISTLSTDDELAFIIGHETAHNVMRHIPKERMLHIATVLGEIFSWRATSGTGAEGVLTDNAFSQRFEDEADYVGIYLAAAAGYDPAGALSAVQVMAREYPDDIKGGIFNDHPGTAERYTQLRKAVEQIKIKQASGLPVWPDFD